MGIYILKVSLFKFCTVQLIDRDQYGQYKSKITKQKSLNSSNKKPNVFPN